jgi:hypothetical protein
MLPYTGTIDPTENRCAVPDPSYQYLCDMWKPPSQYPAYLQVSLLPAICFLLFAFCYLLPVICFLLAAFWCLLSTAFLISLTRFR